MPGGILSVLPLRKPNKPRIYLALFAEGKAPVTPEKCTHSMDLPSVHAYHWALVYAPKGQHLTHANSTVFEVKRKQIAPVRPTPPKHEAVRLSPTKAPQKSTPLPPIPEEGGLTDSDVTLCPSVAGQWTFRLSRHRHLGREPHLLGLIMIGKAELLSARELWEKLKAVEVPSDTASGVENLSIAWTKKAIRELQRWPEHAGLVDDFRLKDLDNMVIEMGDIWALGRQLDRELTERVQSLTGRSL